jgi:DNA-binding transcriptional LysR family regulator
MATIDLSDLGVFVAVVEAASFSRAAARLGLPKSSVSRAIARLEDASGASVLHRTTRQVALSTAGRALYERVREQIASLRDATSELPELAEELSGKIRVTSVVDLSEFFAEVIDRFVGRYPGVDVDLRLTNEYVDLIGEGIDVALRFSTRRLKDSTLNARKLCPSYVQLYASPSYVARQGLPRTPRDLERHTWVVHRHAARLHLEGAGPATLVDTRAEARVECDDFTFLREALVRGWGIGILGHFQAEPYLASGKLVRVLPKWWSLVSNFWAIWPGPRQPPRKVSALLETVDDALRNNPFAVGSTT